MPCGGIGPVLSRGRCFHCNKDGSRHFCEEWDCLIHVRCVPDFLKTEEGKILIEHKHEVYLDFGWEET